MLRSTLEVGRDRVRGMCDPEATTGVFQQGEATIYLNFHPIKIIGSLQLNAALHIRPDIGQPMG